MIYMYNYIYIYIYIYYLYKGARGGRHSGAHFPPGGLRERDPPLFYRIMCI